MTPEEQSAPSGAAPANPQRHGPRRPRRGFRPQRRPRRPSSSQPTHEPPPGESNEIRAELPASQIAESGEPMPADISDQGEEASHSEADHDTPQQPEAPPRRVEAGPAIREAVEQIQRINRDLETLLLEMQKALETLEEAEVQKYADEREVESLRAALRQLNRTRENIPRQQ